MLRRVLENECVADTLRDNPLVFVDVGAAIGIQHPWRSLVAANFCQVVAFEPHPENFANIERVPGGQYFQTAIADFIGQATFHLYGTSSSLKNLDFELDVDAPVIEVEVSTLERLRSEGIIASLDIIKTDVELNDFEAVKGAGTYLSDEVLAVQSEFSMMGSNAERGFADFLNLMGARHFVLAEISLKRSGNGTIRGGDCLFLKDHFAIERSGLDEHSLRVRLVKLLLICCATNNPRYAYYLIRSLEDLNLINEDRMASLKHCVFAKVLLPELFSRSRLMLKLSSMVGAVAQLLAGELWSAKSSFEDNRLRRLPILFWWKRLLPSFAVRRVMNRYEENYLIDKRLRQSPRA